MIDAAQYIKNKKRLEKAEQYLENKWDKPQYAKWQEEYNKILEENLEYEDFYRIPQVSLFEKEKSNG